MDNDNQDTINRLLQAISTAEKIKDLKTVSGDQLLTKCIGLGDDARTIHIAIINKQFTSTKIGDYFNYSSDITVANGITDVAIDKITKGEIGGTHYLKSEFVDRMRLPDYIRDNSPMDYVTIAQITISIAGILEKVHSEGIIHKALSTGSILLDVPKGEKGIPSAFMTGIGVAHIIDFAKLSRSNELIQYFSYLSPEQIKQGKGLDLMIDNTTDLYSLGVIMYQMATGRLPFEDIELIELLQNIVGHNPSSPRKYNPNIPQILDKIIMKLLNKDPENRYQTAKGLISDLQKVVSGKIENEFEFELGRDDRFVRLDYHTRLIGRDNELATLKDSFASALRGNGGIVNIGGVAGAGKTRLAQELRDHLKLNDKLQVSGKFFAGANKEPYGPFKEALESYLESFNNYDQAGKEELVLQLTEAVGANGNLILDFNPKLVALIGNTHQPIQPLDSKDKEDARYRAVLANFLLALAKAESGLTFMLDDWQWCDEASLKLLEELSFSLDESNLLVVNTYRSEEVTPSHPFALLNEQLDNLKINVKHIKIELFDGGKTVEFVAGVLRDDPKQPAIRELADFVLVCSQGNPFFSLEIIRQLVDENYITYNRDSRHWELMSKLEEARIPANIIDAVLKRLEKLTEAEREVLSVGAMIGHKFDIALIFELLEDGDKFTKESIVRIINNALKIQLLNADREDKNGRRYLFVHDRIKEACVEKIGSAKRLEYHQLIAQSMEQKELTQTGNYLFDIAHHYIEAKNSSKVLEWGYLAGIKAKESYANEQAIDYFTQALKVIEAKKSTTEQEPNPKEKELLGEIGEIYLRIGDNDKAIELYLEKLLPENLEKLEKAGLYQKISQAYFKKGDFKNCEFYGEKGLSLLGEKTSFNKVSLFFSVLYETSVHIKNMLLFKDILSNKKAENYKKEEDLAFWLYYGIIWSYAYTDLFKYIRSILRILHITEGFLGYSEELAMAYGGWGNTFSAINGKDFFKIAYNNHKKALTIKKQLNQTWGVAQSLQFVGYCYEWAGKPILATEVQEEALTRFTELGDSKEQINSIAALSHIYFLLAQYTKARDYNNRYLKLAERSKDAFAIGTAGLSEMCFDTELGNLQRAEENGLKALQFLKEQKELNQYTYCTANMEIATLYLEQKELTKAQEHINIAWELYAKNSFLKHYSVNIFNYIAEINHAYILTETKNSKRVTTLKKQTKRALKETKGWPAHYGGALRVRAKYLELVNKTGEAYKLFNLSISHTAKIGRRYEEGKSRYEYALFLNQLANNGNLRVSKANRYKELATEQLRKAYAIFKEIGAKHYLDKSIVVLGGKVELENISSGEDLHLRFKYEELLRIQRLVQDADTVESIASEFAVGVAKTTYSTRVAVLLKDNHSNDVKLIGSIGYDNISQIPDKLINRTLTLTEPLISNDLQNDRDFLRTYFTGTETGPTSSLPKAVMSAPIVISEWNNAVVGMILMCSANSTNIYTKDEQDKTINPLVSAIATLYKQDRITKNSNKIISYKMVEWINGGNDPLNIPSVSTDAAVMFTDIRNFTTISEQIGDPARLTEFLNAFFEVSAKPVRDHQKTGTAEIDKFIGDAMMIRFDDPVTSLKTAIEMRRQVRLFNKERQVIFEGNAPYLDPLEISIGIAYGPLTVGVMGYSGRLDYTSIGDTVNIASRVEGLTKEYHTPILINEYLFDKINPDHFNIRLVDRIRVKGKNKPINIYEEFSLNNPHVVDAKNKMLSKLSELQSMYFQGKDFDDAIKLADDLLLYYENIVRKYNIRESSLPDYLPLIYKERLIEIQNTPELIEKWDGVYTFTRK